MRSRPAEETTAPKPAKATKSSKTKAAKEEEAIETSKLGKNEEGGEDQHAKRAEKKEAKHLKEESVTAAVASSSEDAEGSRKRRRVAARSEADDSSQTLPSETAADNVGVEVSPKSSRTGFGGGALPRGAAASEAIADEARTVATPQRRRSNSATNSEQAETGAEGSGSAAGGSAAEVPSTAPSPRAAPSSPTSVNRNGSEVMCSICCEDLQPKDGVQLPCSHGWYCLTCLKRHAEARLEIGSVDVCCPECNTVLAERTLRRVLPEKIMETLISRSLEQAVSAAGDLYACPTANCAFRVALEDGDVSRLKCPECKKTCCLRCGAQPYHRGLTCKEHAEKLAAKGKNTGEEDLKKWMEETGSKNCPGCNAIVTKENLDKQNTQYVECHKMQCRNCDTRFCFKCLAVLTDKISCGCTRAEHGFINPKTGRRNNHLKVAVKAGKAGKSRK